VTAAQEQEASARERTKQATDQQKNAQDALTSANKKNEST
jgi:hypothetical protein